MSTPAPHSAASRPPAWRSAAAGGGAFYPVVVACLVSLGCGARQAGTLSAEPDGPPAALRLDRAVPGAPSPAGATAPRQDGVRGVYHTLEPGQTLYAIARAYGVPLEALIRANGIADPSHLPDGLPIFIPGAPRRLDVAPTFTPAPGPGDPSRSASLERDPPPAPSGYARASMLPLPSSPDGAGLPAAPPGGGPSGPPTLPPRAPSRPPGGAGGAPGRPSPPALDWPLHGTITSGYGRHRRRHAHHEGIDIDGVVGEPILAAAAGTVVRAGREGGYGRLVVVDHGGGVTTLYAHASRLLVREGERVEAGEEIAEVGRSGNARGSHLHFEVHRDGRPVDPLPYLQVSR